MLSSCLNIQMSGMGKREHPGICPIDQAKRQHAPGPWFASHVGCGGRHQYSRAAILSRVCHKAKLGLKTADLMPLLLEVYFRKEVWGAKSGGEIAVFSQPHPHQRQQPPTCRCQKCGRVKISFSAFSSQGTQFN